VVVLLAIVPTSARAELIKWQYSSTLTSWDPFVAGALDVHTMVIATVAGGNPPTAATGTRIFSLGGLSGSSLVAPNTPALPQFTATIKISDGDSSKSGTLTFSGAATASWIDPSQGTYTVQPFFFKHDDFLELGQHRYDVLVADDFTATVTPSQLANTPEPATCVSALIGIGLAGCCAIRRIRRRGDIASNISQ
jgi:hypothetical protein